MNKVNYAQIYTKLTKGLSPKTKDIFDRRFGVKAPKNSKTGKGQVVAIETLESIGDSMGITRERVRQIEEVGFNHVRKNHQATLDSLFANVAEYFASHGGFKKEDISMQELGGDKGKPYVLFLLTLGNQFTRVCEKKEHHNFWATQKNPQTNVKEVLASIISEVKSHGTLLTKQGLADKVTGKYNLTPAALDSYLEISKRIQSTKDGRLGLIEWPEIKPRGVKDKAYLVFKKENKPLHFRQITQLIDTLDYNQATKKTHAQTVHNELIKDQRFVLVGRGMYALKEWGYVPGTIKDIITNVLKDKPHLVSQEEIVKEVLAQRLVAKNTVMINLNNKKYFAKDSTGKYLVRETA